MLFFLLYVYGVYINPLHTKKTLKTNPICVYKQTMYSTWRKTLNNSFFELSVSWSNIREEIEQRSQASLWRSYNICYSTNNLLIHILEGSINSIFSKESKWFKIIKFFFNNNLILMLHHKNFSNITNSNYERTSRELWNLKEIV